MIESSLKAVGAWVFKRSLLNSPRRTEMLAFLFCFEISDGKPAFCG